MLKWAFWTGLVSLTFGENLPIVKVTTNGDWSVRTELVDPLRNAYTLQIVTNLGRGKTKKSPYVIAHWDEFLKVRILEKYSGAGKLAWRMRLDWNEKPFLFESFEEDKLVRTVRLHADGRIDSESRVLDGHAVFEANAYGGEMGLMTRKDLSLDGTPTERRDYIYEIPAGKKTARLARLERRDPKGELIDQGTTTWGTTNFGKTSYTLRTENWSRADAHVHTSVRFALDARNRPVFVWSSRGSEESFFYDTGSRVSEMILRDSLTREKRRDTTFYYMSQPPAPGDLFLPPEPPALSLTREWEKIPTTGELRNRLVFFRPSGLPGRSEDWSHKAPEKPAALLRKWAGETYAALSFDEMGYLKSKTIHLPGSEKSVSYSYTYGNAKIGAATTTVLQEEKTVSESGAPVRTIRFVYEKPTVLPGMSGSVSPDYNVNAVQEGEEAFYFTGRSLFDLLISESQSASEKEAPLSFEKDKADLMETLRYMARSGFSKMLVYNEKNRLSSFVRLEARPGKYAQQFSFYFYEPLIHYQQMRAQKKPERIKQDAIFIQEQKDLDSDQRAAFEAFAKVYDQNRHAEYLRFSCRFWTDLAVTAVQNSEVTAYAGGMPVAEKGLTGDQLRSWRQNLPGEDVLSRYFDVLAAKSQMIK